MAKGLVTGLLVGSRFSDCLLLRAKEQGLSQDQEGKYCFLMCLGEAWPTAVGRAEHRSATLKRIFGFLASACPWPLIETDLDHTVSPDSGLTEP